MSFADTIKAVENRLQTNWTTTPIKFQNAPFNEIVTPYVALFLQDGEGVQISLGTVAVRRWAGIILVQVFVPEKTGTVVARGYADTIGAIFDRVQFSSGDSGLIKCRTPWIETIGLKDGWWQVNVTVPFRRDRQY